MGFSRVAESLSEYLESLHFADSVLYRNSAAGDTLVVLLLFGCKFFSFGFFVRGFD